MNDVKVVEVLEVKENATIPKDPKRGGGTYKGLLFRYKQGSFEYSKAIHNSVLGSHAEVVDSLLTLVPGDIVEITLKKDGAFTKLASVKKTDKPITKIEHKGEFKKPFEKKSTYVDNSVGMTVGAALHDAVALAVAQGNPSLLKVEQLAAGILNMGERLKKGVTTGVYDGSAEVQPDSIPKKTVKEKVLAGTEEVEFDDPFGDD